MRVENKTEELDSVHYNKTAIQCTDTILQESNKLFPCTYERLYVQNQINSQIELSYDSEIANDDGSSAASSVDF